MPTCPNGHQSGSDDWCEVCGHRMAGAVPPPPPPPPAGGYGYPPPAPGAGPELCPQCRTPREGGAPFCEECRWNFLTNTATSYTPAAPRPASGPPPHFQQPSGPPGPSYGGGGGGDSYPGGRPPEYQGSRPSQVNRPAEPIPQNFPGFGGDPSRPVPPPPGPAPGGPGAPGGPNGPGHPGAPGGTHPGRAGGPGPAAGGPPPAWQQQPGPPPPAPAFPQEGDRPQPGTPPRPGGPAFGGGDDDWRIAPPGGGRSGPGAAGAPPAPAPPGPPNGYGYPGPGSPQAPGHQAPPPPPPGYGYPPQQQQQPPQPQPPHGHQGHQEARQPQAPPPPQGPGTWTATIGPDREYFMAMMQRSGPEAAGLNLPAYSPEQQRPLTGNQLTIGRRRHSTGDTPDIDLSVPPEDPGVSHQHAILVHQPDGSWAVVDQNSTNGTTVNGGEEPIQPYVPVPLQDGDRVHVGAWTTITVRRD
ncbi:FHA domain-containing protein [Streptomyces daghestanicus]|uniref:FHA domain-containing protein n=1 Tax=Streptomyces daghestanicus TaxID=66885 RepID=A0ABQ3QA69_9ACTN|nr:FHA domain-containing protein [Streptomyces daghestanicus]GGU33383.1 hypothetical protein GCM10010259_24780 [Streptomyces daghestanicus]GHI34186.1 hypothetical protein Sdagh_59160 [Streptomyces daghestanicus]